jgi:hypothetical protein
MPKDVPHLAFRFQGKTARESFEERKSQRPARSVPRSSAEFREQLKAEIAQRRSERSIVPAPAPVTRTAPSRKVTAEELKSVVIDMPRAALIALLGEPHSRNAITTAEGTHETLLYQTDAGSTVSIIVFRGKVSQPPR